MEISKELVLKIAKLARLDASNEAVTAKYAQDMGKIVDIFKLFDEVNVEGVRPLVNVSEFDLPLRQDQVTDGNIEDLFSNAPKELYKHFAVPKVIE